MELRDSKMANTKYKRKTWRVLKQAGELGTEYANKSKICTIVKC